MKQYDLVAQLGSQVMYVSPEDRWRLKCTEDGYALALHTRMRTEASALLFVNGIAPRLMVLGGSNFRVRYDDRSIFGPQHPTQKEPVFSFEAFASSDYNRKSEAAVIKDVLVKENEIPFDKVSTETLSATTEENARFVINLFKRRPEFEGVKRIGVLTLLYHMERALPDFKLALRRQRVADEAIEKAGLGYNLKDPNRPRLDPDLEFFPVFAENVLVGNLIGSCNHTKVEEICQYYSTPKGGKQYDVDRIRQLLIEGKSLEEMILPYWYVTVIDGNICADGEPEELEKHSTYSVQARDKKEAALKLRQEHEHLVGIEDFIKGPFDSLEQARKA